MNARDCDELAAPPAADRVDAPRFRARTLDVGGIAAVELVDTHGSARALFARRGATLLDWQVTDRDERIALTDGYADAAELAAQDGVRNGVLAPFPNRIADGRYRFDGRGHDLLPGVAGTRHIYHGFLRELDLAVARIGDGDDGADVLFTGTIEPDAFPGYPFALALSVAARLDAHGIGLVVTATNVGDVAAPYAGGWHPYFRLGDAPLATLELTVPASCTIDADEQLIPLPGDAAFAALNARPTLDFRHPRPLGAQVLDRCYADARPDADGVIRSRLRDPATGRTLTVWQRGGLIHVFTGDTLARDARRSIAIEPVEAMSDAFNRSEFAELLRLPPGATRRFACGAEFRAEPAALPLPTPAAVATA